MPPKSPIDIKDPVLRLTVLIDGSELAEYYPVLSLEIEHEINRISTASLTIVYGALSSTDFDTMSSGKMDPGKSIEIKTAYGNDGGETSIFKGVILKRELRVESADSYKLQLNCSHKARDMTFNKNPLEYSDKADSDIIKDIAGKYGLSCEAAATTPVMPRMLKSSGSSDWDFILARAEFNGQVVLLGADSLKTKAPSLDGTPVLRVAFGESIYSFSAETNLENQATTVKAKSRNTKTQEELEASAKEPSLPDPLKTILKNYPRRVTTPLLILDTSLTQEELQAWADGRLLRMRMSVYRGQVSFIGNGDVQPGDIIELDNMRGGFDGSVYVNSVKHSIEEGNWTTTVKFGLDDKSVTQNPGFTPPAAGGQLPPINGLQVATVSKLSGDPDSEFRVEILFPSQSENPQPIWARIASFYATNESGAVFYPEVGDEVVAGFLASDPRSPVILGALYSTKKASPVPMKDENNYTKALITKSKLKIGFDDDKKILCIETPAGNKITLSDDGKSIEIKDQNSNTINMGSDGISLQTNKDINLKATGNINLSATGKLNLTATQDAAIKGMNISQTADIGFTAKGNATAELSASGQTTVKGGLVMIN